MLVKQGAGTTNAGNVARAFFSKSKAVSGIIEIEEEVITCLHTILQVLSCGEKIDTIKFKDFCMTTANILKERYGWYKIPPSVHKILFHGSDIVSFCDVPFGWLSEEPQEANNKIFRRARINNSRMCNRQSTNEDILSYLLVSSDPLISSQRIKDRQCRKPLIENAQCLLLKENL